VLLVLSPLKKGFKPTISGPRERFPAKLSPIQPAMPVFLNVSGRSLCTRPPTASRNSPAAAADAAAYA
jgi:hypothetical protein